MYTILGNYNQSALMTSMTIWLSFRCLSSIRLKSAETWHGWNGDEILNERRFILTPVSRLKGSRKDHNRPLHLMTAGLCCSIDEPDYRLYCSRFYSQFVQRPEVYWSRWLDWTLKAYSCCSGTGETAAPVRFGLDACFSIRIQRWSTRYRRQRLKFTTC
jgi:hypothetical protein